MDSKLADLFARKRRAEQEQEQGGPEVLPGQNTAAAGGVASPARQQPSAASAAAAQVSPPPADAASQAVVRSPASGAALGISGPAAFSSLAGVVAKLNAENAALRQVAAESTVGPGRLFSRPTPAQLLKGEGGNTLAHVPVADLVAPRGVLVQAPSQQNTAIIEAVKVAVPDASGKGGSPGKSSRHHPPEEDDSPKKPARRSKTSSSSTPSLKSPQQSDLATTPPKAEKKRAPAPVIHPDAVQIGRLDPIPEGDEEEWASTGNPETPREAQSRQAPSTPIQLDDVRIQEFRQEDMGGQLDHEDSEFAGVGALQFVSSSSSSARAGSKSTVSGATAKEIDTKSPAQRRKPQVPAPSSSLQQLSLVQLDSQTKKKEAKRAPAPQYASLEEADVAREAEVLRRQEVLDSMDSLPSSDLPLQIEGILTQGIADRKHARYKSSTKDHDLVVGQHGHQNSSADMEPGAQLSSWTDFARERAKLLGQAVDDAQSAGGNIAQLKLKPGVHDVLLWLRNIGWGQYEDTFAINQIDYDELFVLTDPDLQEMGMKLSSNRLMLLNAIAGLKHVFQTERGSLVGATTDTTTKNKSVFIDGHDNREHANAELIEDQVNFEQKKGYLTWSDYSGKKWKRGFAVIQGSLLHIFKSSDHVVLKPVLSKQLEGALISSSQHAENCVYVQINSIKVSKDDIYICAPDEEERDVWLQHLVAASSLQLLKHMITKNVRKSLPPIIIMLDHFHVNKTGPYALPHLEIKLADRNGSVVTKFEEVGFKEIVDEVVQPNAKGSISLDLSSQFGRQITIYKRLRQEVGPGAILFFEFKHTSREKSSSGAVTTQYWAYAFVDEMTSGDLKLDLLKRPAVYDPFVLKKGSLPRKDKSFIACTVCIKDEKSVKTIDDKQVDDKRTSVAECSRALCSAIRSKLDSADEVVLSSVESLEMLLESLHVLDGPVDTVKEWQKISAQMVNSASSLRGAEPVSKTIYSENSLSKRIVELEEQLAAAKLELDHIRNESKAAAEKAPVQAAAEALTLPATPDQGSPLYTSGKDVVSRYVKLATGQYLGPSPSLKMRPFHWKKLPPNESVNTMWNNAQTQEWNDIVAQMEPAKIEKLFSANQTVRTGADLPSQGFTYTPKKSQKTALIDLCRAQNVSIMLSKLRCSIKELKQAVLSLNASVLDVNSTAELMKFVPSDEEIEVLKAHTGDAEMLGLAECFFLEILGIPRYAERLQVHHFILTFDDRCAELEDKLSSLIKCLTELTKSRRLRRFMLHVLAVGNFLNYGTSMGNATAFRLEALNQTINIKSNVEGVTLLHFLASHVHSSDPDLLKLPGDLANAEAGAAISLSSVSELMAGVKRELSSAVEEHRKCASNDALKRILSDFLPHAQKAFDNIANQEAKSQALFKETKSLYAEERPSVTQEELCGVFSVFKQALVTVIKENEVFRAQVTQMPDDSLDSTLDQSLDKSALESDSHAAGIKSTYSEVHIKSSFSEEAPTQPILSDTRPQTATNPRNDAEACPVSLLEEWLAKNKLVEHLHALKLNMITIDGLMELTDEDFQDLGIIDIDKARMVKAIAKLKRDRQGVLASSEQRSARNRARVHFSPDAPPLAPRSRGPARQGPIVWGVCYGESGEPSKAQKHGWVEIQTRPKTWEKFYAKRARNTLVLFASDTDLSTPARLVCLDGVVVHRSEDKRPFVVEARRSIFQETKDDLALAADSSKEAASWEKALIKGSMWHAENKNLAPAAEPSSSRASGAAGAAAAAAAPAPPHASEASAGLTPEQVESVGQIFTFKSRRSSATTGKGESVDSKSGTAASGVMPSTARDSGLSLVLVQLQHTAEETLQSPFLALTTTATVGGTLMLEPMADIQIRGLPADEHHVLTIGESRTISIPALFQGAADLSVCLELRHQKSDKVSTRAWTYMELNNIKNGERRLQLYSKPVQIGVRSPKTSPLKGWLLTVEVQEVQGCDAA